MDFRTGDGVAEQDGIGREDFGQSELGLASSPIAANGAPANGKAIGMSADDKGSEALVAAMAAGAAGALAAAVKPAPDSKTINARRFTIVTDHARDALLTDFGKDTLDDRYLLPGESYQDLFVRVASAYADDQPHAQRLYDYISRLWFMPFFGRKCLPGNSGEFLGARHAALPIRTRGIGRHVDARHGRIVDTDMVVEALVQSRRNVGLHGHAIVFVVAAMRCLLGDGLGNGGLHLSLDLGLPVD